MSRNKRALSSFELEMQDTSFKKAFNDEYREFALSELLLALMEGEETSVRKLAKAAGLSATSIQKIRSGDQKDIKVSNLIRIAGEFGYSLILEKEGRRIALNSESFSLVR